MLAADGPPGQGVRRGAGGHGGPALTAAGLADLLSVTWAGEHGSASVVDLLIAATAAHHGPAVPHDDADHRTLARHAPDLSEHSVHDVLP
ncbi:hypothetical protein [Streptomyces roseoviridis]|uniref:Uncharacterized protein n=1 Tax=Streptomyces roseoviridis TaxID=67361 RepID=A0ABV5QVH3_9ACTN